MNNGINFGANQRWVATSDNFHKRMAENGGLPLYVRIHHLALSRMNRIGHAEFATDEIAYLLRTEKEDGTVSQPTKGNLDKTIKKAISLGLLGKDSGSRCLVMPEYDAQRNAKASGSCKHHAIENQWSGERDYSAPKSVEAPEKAVEETRVSQDQEAFLEPQIGTQSQEEASEDNEPTVMERIEDMLDENLEDETYKNLYWIGDLLVNMESGEVVYDRNEENARVSIADEDEWLTEREMKQTVPFLDDSEGDEW
jgi:hypothetical protein